MDIQFTQKDLMQMRERGSNPEQVRSQFFLYDKGFPFADLIRPAILQDGIKQQSPDEMDQLLDSYSSLVGEKMILKFVPASGAASRMFKDLFTYLESTGDEYAEKAKGFLRDIPLYAFYEDLDTVMSKAGYSLTEEIKKGNYKTVIGFILNEEGLNYKNTPKGLIKFHCYADRCRYAVEEHLVEAALYARNSDGQCHLHFTVSPAHMDHFKYITKELKPLYEKRFDVVYNINFSVQDPGTDTLAATPDNKPFRNENGELLFRPAGHGALIHNLDKLDGDIVLIKNIDNVVPESKIEPTVLYKKLLTAFLLKIQNQIFHYLKKIECGDGEEIRDEIENFIRGELKTGIPEDRDISALFDFLNRPMRVCGMVKNEGAPGGGPFWVKNYRGEINLQIVETSQIDMDNNAQKKILQQSTHFNPVDMVCGIKNYRGGKFDLTRFIDRNTGFITTKSYGNALLKAMELPGLWNGAMADWITLFVEVPLETFNPAKTVFDLLKR